MPQEQLVFKHCFILPLFCEEYPRLSDPYQNHETTGQKNELKYFIDILSIYLFVLRGFPILLLLFQKENHQHYLISRAYVTCEFDP